MAPAMWMEAILTRDDLDALVARLLPLTLHFGDRGELGLSDPRDVTLVPERGLRVACKARVRWPVLGIDVPVALHSLVVLLRPEIATRAEGQALVFRLEIEHADFAGIPTVIDTRLTQTINGELAAKRVELAWSYGSTLRHAFALPESIEPARSIALAAVDARVKVTADAMGLALLFRFSIARRGEAVDDPPAPPPRELAAPERAVRSAAAHPAIAAAFGAVAGAALLGLVVGLARR